MLGLKYPEADGGADLDFSYSMVMAEALGDCDCGGVPMSIGVQTDMATPALARFGSDELRKQYLAPAIAGDMVGCIGVSEAGGGSDVAALKTYARKDGDDYVINGSKMWITNGLQADWCCLLANTSAEGAPHKNKSLIIVPMDCHGHHQAEDPQDRHVVERHRAAVLRQRARAAAQPDRPGGHGLHLPDDAVPGRAAVGRGVEHHGRWTSRSTRPSSTRASARPSARASSTTRWCTFGWPSCAPRSRRCARSPTAPSSCTRRGKDVTKLASMAKLKCGRLSREVNDACLQYWGGMGFTWDNPVSQAFRDGRLGSIGGGADEVMLGIICKLEGTMPKGMH